MARIVFEKIMAASLFGLSARTVRNWEQGVRHPEGPSRILLQVIDREP